MSIYLKTPTIEELHYRQELMKDLKIVFGIESISKQLIITTKEMYF